MSTEELKGRRLRYLGYIINLSTRSLLDPSTTKYVVAADKVNVKGSVE